MYIDFILIFSSFFTAAITSVFGLSGGLTLLAIMANFFPPEILIPLHSIIVFGNNAQRIIIMRNDIRLNFLLPISIGSTIGVILASIIFISLPKDMLLILLAVGLLLFTWLPQTNKFINIPYFWIISSFITSFISMFIGAGGLLLSAALHKLNLTRQQYVATSSAIAFIQHLPKILAFSFFIGFNFSTYSLLILEMLLSGYIGVHTGKYFLTYMSEDTFKYALKIIISILALRLFFLV